MFNNFQCVLFMCFYQLVRINFVFPVFAVLESIENSQSKENESSKYLDRFNHVASGGMEKLAEMRLQADDELENGKLIQLFAFLDAGKQKSF